MKWPENVHVVIGLTSDDEHDSREEIFAVFYDSEKAFKFREDHKCLRVELWPIEDS